MRDCEHPPEAACGPEALLGQVIETAAAFGVPLTGENALQRCVSQRLSAATLGLVHRSACVLLARPASGGGTIS